MEGHADETHRRFHARYAGFGAGVASDHHHVLRRPRVVGGRAGREFECAAYLHPIGDQTCSARHVGRLNGVQRAPLIVVTPLAPVLDRVEQGRHVHGGGHPRPLAPPNASPARRLAPAPTAPGRRRMCRCRGKPDSPLAPPNASPARRLAPAPTAPGRRRMCRCRGSPPSAAKRSAAPGPSPHRPRAPSDVPLPRPTRQPPSAAKRLASSASGPSPHRPRTLSDVPLPRQTRPPSAAKRLASAASGPSPHRPRAPSDVPLPRPTRQPPRLAISRSRYRKRAFRRLRWSP